MERNFPTVWITQSGKKTKMNRRVHLRARCIEQQKQQENELRKERHAVRRAY